MAASLPFLFLVLPSSHASISFMTSIFTHKTRNKTNPVATTTLCQHQHPPRPISPTRSSTPPATNPVFLSPCRATFRSWPLAVSLNHQAKISSPHKNCTDTHAAPPRIPSKTDTTTRHFVFLSILAILRFVGSNCTSVKRKRGRK